MISGNAYIFDTKFGYVEVGCANTIVLMFEKSCDSFKPLVLMGSVNFVPHHCDGFFLAYEYFGGKTFDESVPVCTLKRNF